MKLSNYAHFTFCGKNCREKKQITFFYLFFFFKNEPPYLQFIPQTQNEPSPSLVITQLFE